MHIFQSSVDDTDKQTIGAWVPFVQTFETRLVDYGVLPANIPIDKTPPIYEDALRPYTDELDCFLNFKVEKTRFGGKKILFRLVPKGRVISSDMVDVLDI